MPRINYTCSNCSEQLSKSCIAAGCRNHTTCPKCKPKLWRACPSCSQPFHNGICNKCKLFAVSRLLHCLACGKRVKTWRTYFETCQECSFLPYSVIKSMIRERRNEGSDLHMGIPACRCNNCGS